jgi:predicted  nucleic acid-binding Zn-ribbon protein
MNRFGSQSKKIARWLRELSDLDLNIRSNTPVDENGAAAERINVLRGLIPTSMLQHYDHLKSRGKRSVAPITRGVCGSCHLAFPSGVLANLRRTSETLNVCVNCGAFVYLDEQNDNSPVANASDTRGRKGALNRGSAPGRSIAKSRKERSKR